MAASSAARIYDIGVKAVAAADAAFVAGASPRRPPPPSRLPAANAQLLSASLLPRLSLASAAAANEGHRRALPTSGSILWKVSGRNSSTSAVRWMRVDQMGIAPIVAWPCGGEAWSMVAWHSHFADATQVTEAFAAWCAAAAGKANGRRCGRGVDGDVAREV